MDAQASTIFPSTTSSAHEFARVLVVAGAHILLLMVLLHVGRTPVWEQQVRPLMVSLISAPKPVPIPQALAPTVNLRHTPPTPHQPLVATQPLIEVALRAEPAPSEVSPAVALPVVNQSLAADPSSAAPVKPTPSAPVPPQRPLVTATAANYLVMPPAEVPRLAKRAGESGTVWLRVVVDTAGLPVKVSLHRSSGFARLDEQALWAMRQARFKPHTEDGRAVEVDVIAPIEYPAD